MPDKLPFLTLFIAALLAPLLLCSSASWAKEPARIAIIIDDIGYHLARGQRTIDLPADITLSFLPHAPNSHTLAVIAHSQGKEIMLHAPMSNTSGKPLDAGALTSDMTRPQFLEVLRQDLAAIPHIQGLNNHMGSMLTQQADPMHWLMSELIDQQLFFIDSRTSPNSLAYEIAQDYALPSLKRDIFLDHQRNTAFIEQQFDQLIRLASRRGWALAIGHPYPETLAVLEQRLPQLAELGIEVVAVSTLLQPQMPAKEIFTTEADTTPLQPANESGYIED